LMKSAIWDERRTLYVPREETRRKSRAGPDDDDDDDAEEEGEAEEDPAAEAPAAARSGGRDGEAGRGAGSTTCGGWAPGSNMPLTSSMVSPRMPVRRTSLELGWRVSLAARIEAAGGDTAGGAGLGLTSSGTCTLGAAGPPREFSVRERLWRWPGTAAAAAAEEEEDEDEDEDEKEEEEEEALSLLLPLLPPCSRPPAPAAPSSAAPRRVAPASAAAAAAAAAAESAAGRGRFFVACCAVPFDAIPPVCIQKMIILDPNSLIQNTCRIV
jgi:hypothetical protein